MEGGNVRASYEQDLNRLKEAQRNAAVANLENTRNQALSNLEAERQSNATLYNQQRSTANAQNRMNAKNFQEYLASTGRANSGLPAQAKMQYDNNLQNSLSYLNAGEAGALADINRRSTLAHDAYNTGLASANASIEADYIKNLMNEREKEQQRQLQERQLQESIRQFNENLALQREKMYSSTGNSPIIQQVETPKYDVNTPYYQGAFNNDVKYGTFSNGYQPDNIGGAKLKSSGKTVGQMFGKGTFVGKTGANLDDQKVWTVNGKYYIWDGSQNQYIQVR